MHSLRTRLLALTAVPVAALIVLGALAIANFGNLSSDLRATDRRLAVVRAQSAMDMMHDALRGDVLDALLATSPADAAQAEASARGHTDLFRQAVATLVAADLPPALRQEVLALQPRLEAYVDIVVRLVSTATTDRAAAVALRPQFDAAFRSLETANDALGDHLEATGGDIDTAITDAEHGRIEIIIIALIAGALTIGGGVLIGRGMARALREAGAVLRRVAEGDLRGRATGADQTEVGAMLGSLNTGLDQISTMLVSIRSASQGVLDTATQVDHVAKTLGSNSQRASQDTSSASAAASQASANVQAVAAATEEIAATIRDVARNAQEAARVAANGVVIATRSNATVARLGASSNEIGAVVDVITQIAEQTNLLALNATIEAARAGAAGRGFAVVANEIKELAKQTARATEEIRTKIVGIQRETDEAVKDIGQIGEVIGQIDNIQQSIASAVAEQATVTGDIGRNLTEVATAADSIARDMSAADQAIRDNVAVAEQATSTATALGDLARRLDGAVGSFRVRDRERGNAPRATAAGTRVTPPVTGPIEVMLDAADDVPRSRRAVA